MQVQEVIQQGVASPSIYYIPGALAGPLASWPRHFERARAMGLKQICTAPLGLPGRRGDLFLLADPDKPDPRLGPQGSTAALIAALAASAATYGFETVIDVVLDRVADEDADGRTYKTASLNRAVVDPRIRSSDIDAAFSRFDDRAASAALLAQWSERLASWRRSGAAGFRLLGLERVPPEFLAALIEAVDGRFLAWTPGLAWEHVARLTDIGLDGVFASTPWWDGRASWYAEEHALLRRVAPIIAPVEVPFGPRSARRASDDRTKRLLARQVLQLGAATSEGLFVPMGFESLVQQPLQSRFPAGVSDGEPVLAGDVANAVASLGGGTMRGLTGPGSKVTALSMEERHTVVLINTDLTHGLPSPLPLEQDEGPLAPGEVRIVAQPERSPIVSKRRTVARDAAKGSRVIVENISPRVAGGPFAAKRIVGHTVTVETDAYTDGHDVLAVELLWKAADADDWQRVPMASLGNARWRASFTPFRMGRYLYAVESWIDDYATLCRAIRLKQEAGVDISVELAEIREALVGVSHDPAARTALSDTLAILQDGDAAAGVRALISPKTRRIVAEAGERPFATRSEPLALDVEREAAGFAAWYELFPRSMTDDPARHGTFDDVIAQLPRVRDMGFDVLYFPPIHPIGTKARKGRNNTLTPGPTDVGSPYAIGSPEGGHDALHPALGTFEDFRRLVDAAHAHGLEIAIDFAIQCSPDHPWLKQHPDWFRHRPDGTIKHAENPPKKYEDIVNVDFYAEGAIPGLWQALRDVVLFWIGQGVTIFRVDNPHTKPLPFWQWMIADVRARHPAAIFLSEAFTHPKMMYRLAKVGFSQSYSYFTWRNTRQELTEYLTELTTTAPADFFRPNFFVNTPDINPLFLQDSGRAGFLIRAVLAATLSGLWGVYSGFELCEAAALPGREEYLDSEKYEIRVRDFGAPGNIVNEITRLNRIRRANPALHSHLGVRFYNSSNEQVIVYGKALPSHEDMVFAIVNLDPRQPQETRFEIPLWEWNLPDSGALQAEDLMTGRRFTLHGKEQSLRLDPGASPFVLWRLFPEEGSPS